MNMMLSAKGKGSEKKKDDDPTYYQFSDSLRKKIEDQGDERSKNLLEKLLKQLSKSGGSNNEETLRQLDLLNQQYDKSNRKPSPTDQYMTTDPNESMVPSLEDIRQNRKLIRRQFYVDDDGAQTGSAQRKEKEPSKYQKLIEENKK